MTHGYWATDTRGQATSSGGTGLTLAELQAALPEGFDPVDWANANNQSTPYLKALGHNVAYIATDPARTTSTPSSGTWSSSRLPSGLQSLNYDLVYEPGVLEIVKPPSSSADDAGTYLSRFNTSCEQLDNERMPCRGGNAIDEPLITIELDAHNAAD